MGLGRKIEKELKRRGRRIDKDLRNLRDDLVEKVLSASKEPSAPDRVKNPRGLLPGLAVIFNNQHFEDPSHSRSGSEKDVERLKQVFEKYSVRTLVIQDPSAPEIRNVIEKVVSEIDFLKRSSILITVLTHGSRFDTLLAADNMTYSFYETIMFPLFNHLKGIPKIIFTQACKGNTNLYLQRDSFDFPERPENPEGSPDEVFRFDSSFEGYVSLRHKNHGSFFIQTLCKALDQFGDDYSIQEIAEFVQDNIRDNESIRDCQFPSINDKTLSKPFFIGDFKVGDKFEVPSTENVDHFIDLVNSLN